MNVLPEHWRDRLGRVPWAAVGLSTLALVLLVAVVPLFRRAAATVGSRVILFVARPFAPSTSGFDDLQQASRVLATDGSEVGLVGTELRDPLPLERVPDHVVHAVLAAEDANFIPTAASTPRLSSAPCSTPWRDGRRGGARSPSSWPS